MPEMSSWVSAVVQGGVGLLAVGEAVWRWRQANDKKREGKKDERGEVKR